jgi:hypothetical protein
MRLVDPSPIELVGVDDRSLFFKGQRGEHLPVCTGPPSHTNSQFDYTSRSQTLSGGAKIDESRAAEP